jgi:hypothetical protein
MRLLLVIATSTLFVSHFADFSILTFRAYFFPSLIPRLRPSTETASPARMSHGSLLGVSIPAFSMPKITLFYCTSRLPPPQQTSRSMSENKSLLLPDLDASRESAQR